MRVKEKKKLESRMNVKFWAENPEMESCSWLNWKKSGRTTFTRKFRN